MARTAAEACMFCGTPHTGQCGGKPARPKAERVKKASPPSPVVLPSLAPSIEAPSEVGPPEESVVSEASVFAQKARPNLANVNRVRDPHEVELGRALTLFAERDMMSHKDLITHRGIISLPDYKIDALIWKQVNDETVRKYGG